MGVSRNKGTPKSSILIGFSITNHPFWGTPIFGNTHMGVAQSIYPFQVVFSSPILLDPKWEKVAILCGMRFQGHDFIFKGPWGFYWQRWQLLRFLAISNHLLDLWIRWKIMGFQLAFPQLVSWSRISEPSTVTTVFWIVSPIFLHNQTPNSLTIDVTCWWWKTC